MDTILEGLRLTLPDGILIERWVPHAELIASRERVITLEKELAGIIEGFTEPEQRCLELESEITLRDAWIRKLVRVKTEAANIIERVPELLPVGVGLGSQVNTTPRMRLRIRQVAPGTALLQPLWDALVELDEFGEKAK